MKKQIDTLTMLSTAIDSRAKRFAEEQSCRAKSDISRVMNRAVIYDSRIESYSIQAAMNEFETTCRENLEDAMRFAMVSQLTNIAARLASKVVLQECRRW